MNIKYTFQKLGLGLLLALGTTGCSKTSTPETPAAPANQTPSEKPTDAKVSDTKVSTGDTKPNPVDTKPNPTDTKPNPTDVKPTETKMGSAVVARLGDMVLTEVELNNLSGVYEARLKAINEWMTESIVKKRAKAQGKTVDELLEAQVGKPTEEEAKKVYEQTKASGRLPEEATFDMAKGDIYGFLQEQKEQQAIQPWIMEELKTNKPEILLPDPIREVAAAGPSKGAKDAKVTIVEFSDFQCPFCSKGQKVMEEVEKKYGDKVRIVFRDFPLDFHDKAKKAAEAGQCAHKQGKFWAMHDHMFAHQDKLDVANLKSAAKELGLNTDEFNRCLDSGETAPMIAKNLKVGAKVGVRGTPAFFVNGVFISGAQPLEKFSKEIDKVLAGK